MCSFIPPEKGRRNYLFTADITARKPPIYKKTKYHNCTSHHVKGDFPFNYVAKYTCLLHNDFWQIYRVVPILKTGFFSNMYSLASFYFGFLIHDFQNFKCPSSHRPFNFHSFGLNVKYIKMLFKKPVTCACWGYENRWSFYLLRSRYQIDTFRV